jgi:hypothetical protein
MQFLLSISPSDRRCNVVCTPPAGRFTQVGAGNVFGCGIGTDGTLPCCGTVYGA